MYSNVSGNIGIDTDDPEYKLDVKGSFWADNISTKSIQMITTNKEKSIPLETYISLIEFMKNQGKYSTGINSFECNKPPNNLKPVNTLINAFCGQVGIGVRSFNDNIFPKFEVDGGDVYFHNDLLIGGSSSSKIFRLASVNYVSNGINKSYFAIRPPTDEDWKDYNALILTDEGKVSIGGIFNKTAKINVANNIPDGYKLYVNDGILTEKVKVALCTSNESNPIDCDGSEWKDYVFDDNYKLMDLKELDTYIKQNKHLPEIPSAKEVVAEGGFELGYMTKTLLKKVEELTLYTINQDKKLELQQELIQKQSKEIEELKQLIKNKISN